MDDMEAPAPGGNQDTGEEAKQVNDNPFADLDQVRIAPGEEDIIGVERVVTVIPVRKPRKQEWVRTHLEPDMRITTRIIELKDEQEMYYVRPEILPACPEEVEVVTLRAAITRTGAPFLWPLKEPDTAGRSNSWHESARQASMLAERAWVKVRANMSAGCYDVGVAKVDLAEPEWPDPERYPLSEWLRIAFRGLVIDSQDHIVLRQLRGEA